MSINDDSDDPTLHAVGFDKALIGHTVWSCGRKGGIAIYDYDKCIRILMRRDKMTREEATEYMDFNVAGAWVGEWTPIFMSKEDIR